MNHTSLIMKKVSLFMILLSWNLTAQKGLSLKKDQSCAQWQTKKKTLFIFKSTLQGTNCHLNYHIKEQNKLYKVFIDIPLGKFDSGNKKRDQDITKILSNNNEKTISFTSEERTAQSWAQLLTKKKFTLTGYLTIKNKKYRITTEIERVEQLDKTYFIGEVKTSFSYFEITPPKVLGGFLGKVSNELKLKFQIAAHMFELDKNLASLAELKTLTKTPLSEKKNLSFYEIPVELIDKSKLDLNAYRGKVVVIVNIASKCGFKGQLGGLQNLSNKYKENNLEILAFPSNDFYQEPLEGENIGEFCQKNYGVTFPIAKKTSVNGKGAHLMYKFLLKDEPPKKIRWNFEKFLVDPKGKVYKRYSSMKSVEGSDLEDDIKTLLGL